MKKIKFFIDLADKIFDDGNFIPDFREIYVNELDERIQKDKNIV